MVPVAFAGAAEAGLSVTDTGGEACRTAEIAARAPIDAATKKTAELIVRKALRLRFARGLYVIGGAAEDWL